MGDVGDGVAGYVGETGDRGEVDDCVDILGLFGKAEAPGRDAVTDDALNANFGGGCLSFFALLSDFEDFLGCSFGGETTVVGAFSTGSVDFEVMANLG